MIRRDYFLRYIERAGPFLKKLIGLGQADKQQEAQQVLQAALRELINLDSRMVLALSAKDLRDLLSIDESQAAGKGLLVAELIAEYSESAVGQEADDLRQKAGELFRWVATLPGGKEAVEASEGAKRCL